MGGWKRELKSAVGFVGCLIILVATIAGCVGLIAGAAMAVDKVSGGAVALAVPLWAVAGIFAFNMVLEWGTRP